VKLVKSSEAFDSLRLLTRSVYSCIPIFIWSTILLFMVQAVVGMCLTSAFFAYMEDTSYSMTTRTQLFVYFGSFSRSIFTMFELCLGNWVPVGRFLMDDISEWLCLFILAHKLVVGFAVIRIISGVFLHETFKSAATDDDLMLMQKKRLILKHTKMMQRFMEKADMSGDGALSKEEFRRILKSDDVRAWFAAQEIDAGDADLLFFLLDTGDEKLTPDELVVGVTRLKGAAKSIDLYGLMHMVAVLLQAKGNANMSSVLLQPGGVDSREVDKVDSKDVDKVDSRDVSRVDSRDVSRVDSRDSERINI